MVSSVNDLWTLRDGLNMSINLNLQAGRNMKLMLKWSLIVLSILITTPYTMYLSYLELQEHLIYIPRIYEALFS